MIFWMLICGHALCDYPLQGDFLAKGKNHTAPLPGVPWWICLLAHALIHGGMVTAVTGSLYFGVAEALLHVMIDYSKCAGWFGFATDQGLHIFCKAVWAFVLGATA